SNEIARQQYRYLRDAAGKHYGASVGQPFRFSALSGITPRVARAFVRRGPSSRFSMKSCLAFLFLFPLCLCAEEAVTVRKDVSFLGESRKEKLDVYLPPTSFARPVPAVVLIHGGGWSGGSKSQTASMSRTLAGNGYAVFTIDYLLNELEKK